MKEGLEIKDIYQEYTGEFKARRDEMLEKAKKARDTDAVSHRGFLVGSSVLGMAEENNSKLFKVYSAGNYTPEDKEKSEEGKWCSERVSINMALSEGVKYIPGIVSVSNENDARNGEKVHDVLHPCLACRNLMRLLKEEGIMSDNTIIVCANDSKENPGEEEMNLGSLLSKYEQDYKIKTGVFKRERPIPFKQEIRGEPIHFNFKKNEYEGVELKNALLEFENEYLNNFSKIFKSEDFGDQTKKWLSLFKEKVYAYDKRKLKKNPDYYVIVDFVIERLSRIIKSLEDGVTEGVMFIVLERFCEEFKDKSLK